jgi:hypothetical protein
MAANPTKKAVVANGSIEVIGGGVRPGGDVAIPNAAEGEICAMMGEMKSTNRFGNGQLMACGGRGSYSHVWSTQYHMTHVTSISLTAIANNTQA